MRRIVFVLAFISILFSAIVPAPAADPAFKIVINTSNTTSSITKAQLSKCFMKQATTWISGQTITPVDQSPASQVRAAFSTAIHDRDVNAVKSFWQRQIFSGRGVPPAEKGSDSEVLAFVAANPGAVGYVSPDAAIVANVKVLAVTDL